MRYSAHYITGMSVVETSSRVLKLACTLSLGFVKYKATSIMQVPTAVWLADVGKDTPFHRILLEMESCHVQGQCQVEKTFSILIVCIVTLL